MRRFLALPLVLACTDTTTPVDQAPAPYPGFELVASSAAIRGGVVTVTAQLPVPPAPPNGLDVFFVEGGGLGPGICHPALRGSCLDITGPYTVHGPITSAAGESAIQLPVPQIGTDIFVQAVVFPPRGLPAALSTPLQEPIVAANGDFAFCGQGTVSQCVDPAELSLWLRADLAGAPGPLAGWTDLSDADTNLVQPTMAKQPQLVADAIGGRAAARFDGVDDRLDLPVNLFAPGSEPLTVTIVMQADSPNAHVLGTGSSSAGFLDTYGSGLTLSGGRATAKANSASTGVLLSSRDNVIGQPHIITYVSDGVTTEVFVDGEPQGSSDVAPNGHGYSRATLGASDGSVSNASRDPLDGDIAEVLVFARALGDAEREELEGGLGGFYNIGIWQPTGCDGVVNSGATFDRCGVCEGDGTTCAVVDDLLPELWLRGDDLEDAGPVDLWSDASASTNAASQPEAARRPTFAPNAIQGHGAVFFDGVNDRLDLTDNAFGSGEYPKTVFMVLQTSDTSAHLIGTGSSSGGFLSTYGGGLVLDGGELHAKANSANNGLYARGVAPVANDQPRLVSVVMNSGASEIWVDGVSVGSSASSLSAHAYSRSTLGASDGSASNASQDPFEGWLAEVVSFEGALDPQDRRSVEDYLATRYGLTLPPPGAVGGVTLWLDAEDHQGMPDGTPLALWADRSVQANDAEQSAANRQPTVHTVGGQTVVRFDGADDRLDLLDNAFGSTRHPLTVFAVLRSSDVDAHIVGTGSSGAGFLTSYGGGLILEGGSVAGKAISNNAGTFLQDPSAFDDGAMHIVSFVSETGNSSLYVDGAFVDSASTSTLAHAYGKSTVGASDGSNSDQARDPLDGDIAEIRVYGRPLSAAARQTVEQELAAKHNIPTLPSGVDPRENLSLFWRMDEDGTASRTDSMRSLTIAPFPVDAVGTTSIPAKVGMGQLVDGPNGYHFWRGSHPDLDHGGSSFTWAGWVRLDSLYGDQSFVGKWEFANNDKEFRIYADVARGHWVFEVSGSGQDGPGQSIELVHPAPLTVGGWAFLEAWHDATGEVGFRVGDEAAMGTPLTAPWSGGVHFGSNDLNIGAHNQCGTAHLDGAIDAVGMWRAVLTDDQRTALWNNGQGWEP